MSNVTPNDLARDAMAKAAAKYDDAGASAEVEADLWRQCAEHLRRGQLMRADLKREEAIRARETRHAAKTVEADQLLKLVQVADSAFWRGQAVEGAVEDVDSMPIEICRALLKVHRSACGNRNCPIEVALRARLGDV